MVVYSCNLSLQWSLRYRLHSQDEQAPGELLHFTSYSLSDEPLSFDINLGFPPGPREILEDAMETVQIDSPRSKERLAEWSTQVEDEKSG